MRLVFALECSEDSPYSIEAITEEEFNEVPEIAYSDSISARSLHNVDRKSTR